MAVGIAHGALVIFPAVVCSVSFDQTAITESGLKNPPRSFSKVLAQKALY